MYVNKYLAVGVPSVASMQKLAFHAQLHAPPGLPENIILLCPTCHTVVDKAPDD
jgi:hypothetical protein